MNKGNGRGGFTREQGIAAFWAKVTKTEGCWLYIGHRVNETGHCDLTRNLKKILAHRYSWMIHHGPIPAGKHVLHRCNVANCIRPDHLYLGTDKDNHADQVAAGHTRSGEKSYTAKLTPDQVRRIRDLKGKMSQRQAGWLYNISGGHVYRIWAGESWKHLP